MSAPNVVDLVPDYLARAQVSGRRYVVVGAGGRIGRQVCHALAQAGAAQVLCVDRAESAAVAISAEIGIGLPWSVDPQDDAQLARLPADAFARLRSVDGFVDIIGGENGAPVLSGDGTWDPGADPHVRQLETLSGQFGAAMAEQGQGAIVMVASVTSLYRSWWSAPYRALMDHVVEWTRWLATELGPAGVRVNAVAPGINMTARMMDLWDARVRRTEADDRAAKAVGGPADIAAGVLYLLSDSAAFVTGHALPVGAPTIDARRPLSTAQ
jgi:NAD(P)-dependent dehydrogenase (short-subunit alcohol dehydrogenase family)